MILVQVKFVFPFRIALADEAFRVRDGAFRVRILDETYFVRIVAKSGTRTLVYHDDPRADQGAVWYKAVIISGGEEVSTRELCFSLDPSRFLEKVIDHIGFTLFEVTFEVPEPIADGDKRRIRQIEAQALKAAQHFVSHYRAVSNDSDVFRPSERDSPGVETYVADKYVFSDQYAEASFRLINRTIRWEPPRVTRRAKPPLSMEKARKLNSKLRRDQVLPVHFELLLDGKEYSIIHRNHRMAIVVIQSAFEAFLHDRLTKECEHRGIIELTDGRGRTTRPYDEAILSGTVRDDLLGTYFSELCGHSVKSGPEYSRWYDDAYKPRNEIVHRGKHDVAGSDAEVAFKAVIADMNYLSQELMSSRP